MRPHINEGQLGNPMAAAILINYNGLSLTREAIRSLEASEIPVHIIVVDNASAADEGRRIQEACPGVTVLRSEENLGFAGGNNLGIRYALSRGYAYILLMNNDTVAAADMVGELLRYAGPDTVTAPVIYYYDQPDRINFGGGRLVRWKGGAEHLLENTEDRAVCSCEENGSVGMIPVDRDRPDNAGGGALGARELAKKPGGPILKGRRPRECNFLTGCCMLIHRDILEKVGLMDESYFMYVEDVDFSIRLLQHHRKMLVVPSARLWHKVGVSSGGDDTVFTAYYGTRNRIALIRKHRKFFTRFTMAVFVLSRLVKMLRYAAKHSPCAKAAAWGIMDAARGLSGKSGRDLRGR